MWCRAYAENAPEEVLEWESLKAFGRIAVDLLEAIVVGVGVPSLVLAVVVVVGVVDLIIVVVATILVEASASSKYTE